MYGILLHDKSAIFYCTKNAHAYMILDHMASGRFVLGRDNCLCGPRRLEVGFSHYLTLNWISINKDSGLCSIRFTDGEKECTPYCWGERVYPTVSLTSRMERKSVPPLFLSPPYEEILDISLFFTLILTFSCCSLSMANTGDEVIYLHYFDFVNFYKKV